MRILGQGMSEDARRRDIEESDREWIEQQQQAMSEIKYKIVNGTSYHEETSNDVVIVLEKCRLNNVRIVLDYGDIETGQSWGEQYDITGTLARSMGPRKVPILLYNARSMGGGAILDHCIVRVQEARGKRILYKHPKYKPYEHN